MTEARYQIIFTSEVVDGINPDKIKENLSALFKLNIETIDRLFLNDSHVIRKNINYQSALRFKKALKEAGALCRIEKAKETDQKLPEKVRITNLNDEVENAVLGQKWEDVYNLLENIKSFENFGVPLILFVNTCIETNRLNQASLLYYSCEKKKNNMKWKEWVLDFASRNPSNLVTCIMLGDAYLRLSEYDLSISEFDKAIKIDKNNADIYNKRGNAYLKKGQYDIAMEDFKKAIQSGTLNGLKLAYAYNNRGSAYLEKGELDQAIEDYSKAIQIYPNCVDAYNNRGNLYIDTGRYAHAIKDLNRAIKIDSKSAIAYYNRGVAHLDMSQYDEAIEDLNQAIQIDQEYALAYCNRGFCYNNIGEYDRAIEDSNIAIQIDPNDAAAYNNRGFAYNNKHEYDKARMDFEKTIDLDPFGPIGQAASQNLT